MLKGPLFEEFSYNTVVDHLTMLNPKDTLVSSPKISDCIYKIMKRK